jgi:diguanylate cyclase (GGDEF)-like protein
LGTSVGFLRQGDVCTRYGGEEFVVVLPNTRLETAEEVAERLRSGVDEEVLLTVPLVKATVSIGVAEFSVGCSVKQLLNDADEAMYAAKRGGRNQVRAHADA